MLMLKKKTIKALAIKNGANGISVFIEIFLRVISKTIILIIVPIQKESTMQASPEDKPKIQPRPSMSLASPKPIHFPLEISQRRANGEASNGPAMTEDHEGKINNLPNPK